MRTLIPQGAEIKLLFTLWQAVFEIELIFVYATLGWFAAYMFYMYTLIPHGAQIRLLFALRQAVFKT